MEDFAVSIEKVAIKSAEKAEMTLFKEPVQHEGQGKAKSQKRRLRIWSDTDQQ